MKQEIYDDIIEEIETFLEKNGVETSGKEYKKLEKRLQKSIGNVLIDKEYKTTCNEEGKPYNKLPTEEKMVWDVVLGDGDYFEVNNQKDAIIISLLVQINERLKRVEKSIGRTD